MSGVIVTVATNGAAPAGTDSVHRTPEASVTLSVDAVLGLIWALAARALSGVPTSRPSPEAAPGGKVGTGIVGVLVEREPVADGALVDRGRVVDGVPVAAVRAVDGVLGGRAPVVDEVPQAAHSSPPTKAPSTQRRTRAWLAGPAWRGTGPLYHRHRWYHTYMEKTTIYLPDDLKSAVKRAAAQLHISEAEVIRQSVRQAVGAARPRPRGGLFSSGQPIARRAEELLSGFGER